MNSRCSLLGALASLPARRLGEEHAGRDAGAPGRSGSWHYCIRQLSIYLAVSALLANARLLSASPAEYSARPYAGDDLFADTWVATDGGGRKVPGFAECGNVK